MLFGYITLFKSIKNMELSEVSTTGINSISNISILRCPSRQEKKETKIIHEGSQDGKIGSTHYATMIETFTKLNLKAESGIRFNASRLVSYLFGGTCTAMAFGFIKDYLASNETNLQQRCIQVMKGYTKSCQTFRAQQIAFNTIEYSPNTQAEDLKKAKAQSLANYYDLELGYTSGDLQYEDILNKPELLKNEIEMLPEGIYFLRILRPEDNHKGERWGHSTVYIKDKLQGDYFYDPNYGLTEIADGETPEFFLSHFETLKDAWLVSNPRFYQIKV